MKTPEEMAEEYGTGIDLCCGTSDIIIAAEKGFLAGYQAAKDQLRETVIVLEKHKAAAEKAVTNIKNASDWVTIEKAKANENA